MTSSSSVTSQAMTTDESAKCFSCKSRLSTGHAFGEVREHPAYVECPSCGAINNFGIAYPESEKKKEKIQ